MSIEQWGILALVIAVPLLEGVARLWRARGTRSLDVGRGDTAARSEPRPSSRSHRHTSESVMRAAEMPAMPTASRPPPLPPPTSHQDESFARLRPSPKSSSRGSGSSERLGPAPKPRSDAGVVQWLRPARNLRRAMVVATILSPPSR